MTNGLKDGVGLNADARNRGDAGIDDAGAAAMVANKPGTSETVVAADQRPPAPETASEITVRLSALLCGNADGTGAGQYACEAMGRGEESAWTQETVCDARIGMPEPRPSVL